MLEGTGEYNKGMQCEMLSLNRTGIYYKKRPEPKEKIAILNAMDEIFTENPVFGARKIRMELLKQGHSISRPTVANYMRALGLEAIYQKPDTSKPHPEHKIYPYLLRNISASYPNHIWGTDITYIRMRDSFMYLVAYLDWYSRYVVSWGLSETLEDGFVVAALKAALKESVPHIANSDQGSQFTGHGYTGTLLEHGVKISMDGRGRCMDNIFTERLWRTVKYEDIYINDYSSPRELRRGLDDFFKKYNTRRSHQSLGYRTPADVYFETT
jgi:putative transposase